MRLSRRDPERTRSLGYSLFNLEAFFSAAALGDHAGVDLWSYETADGRSIRRALDFLLPYADPALNWPHPQIADAPWPTFAKLLALAAGRFDDPRYAAAHARLPQAALSTLDNLLPHPPR